MGRAERAGPAPVDPALIDPAPVDVVSLARSLRAAGAPVTSDDIADAATGLMRLGSTDPELVHAVLDATIGKYGGRTARSSGGDGRSDASTAAPAPASEATPTGGAAATGDDEHGASITMLTGRPTRPTTPPATGETVSADVDRLAASLGVQTAQQGSARETSVELTGAAHRAAARPAPVGPSPPSPRPWALPSRRSPLPALAAHDAVPDGGAMATAVRSLATDLDGGSSRRRSARAGSIDLHRTLATARRRGGRLLPPARRRRGRRRPAATLVVDVSPSVRGATALPIAVAHRLARTGRRTRVFAATDRLTEVTSVFRSRDPGPGLERAVAGADLDPTASSDWGRVLTELDRTPTATAPNVHVVVLGDGRSIGTTDGVVPLDRIARRAASVRWATPEPTGAWPLGSGEPARYAGVVTTMATVRTPADLGELELRRSKGGAN